MKPQETKQADSGAGLPRRAGLSLLESLGSARGRPTDRRGCWHLVNKRTRPRCTDSPPAQAAEPEARQPTHSTPGPGTGSAGAGRAPCGSTTGRDAGPPPATGRTPAQESCAAGGGRPSRGRRPHAATSPALLPSTWLPHRELGPRPDWSTHVPSNTVATSPVTTVYLKQDSPERRCSVSTEYQLGVRLCAKLGVRLCAKQERRLPR